MMFPFVLPGLRRFLIVLFVSTLFPLTASAFVYDFTTNDAGWTRYDPLGSLGAPASYQFPGNGGYEVIADQSPNPNAVGPSRAGSLRTDLTFSDFVVSIDLPTWSVTHDQAIGLLGRVTNPGLGSTNGYALTYSVGAHEIDLTRITGEAPTNLAKTQVFLDPNPADPVRLVFFANGSNLTGQVFRLSNLSAALATVNFSDPTYASGNPGVIVFDNTDTAINSLGADATFAHFVAVPEPAAPFALLMLAACGRARRRRSRYP
jgi:hypothetical protein